MINKSDNRLLTPSCLFSPDSYTRQTFSMKSSNTIKQAKWLDKQIEGIEMNIQVVSEHTRVRESISSAYISMLNIKYSTT